MSDTLKIFQHYPVREIPERNMPAVSIYHTQGMAVAGQFFEVGGSTICLARNADYQSSLHRIPHHRFVLMVQGRMEFTMGKKTFIAEPGDLVCAPAETVTKRTALDPVEWVYLDIDDVPLWTPLKKAGPTVRKYPSAGLMYILVKEIIDALRSQDLNSIRCAYENSGMLVTLLERELRQYSREWKPKRADSMIDLVDRIRENPADDWNRTSLAKAVGTSERNLTIVFDQVFGTSPGKMITRIRMEHAMMMLKEDTETVETIGQSVGYESIVSFSRAFKNYLGMSPGAYRKKVKE